MLERLLPALFRAAAQPVDGVLRSGGRGRGAGGGEAHRLRAVAGGQDQRTAHAQRLRHGPARRHVPLRRSSAPPSCCRCCPTTSRWTSAPTPSRCYLCCSSRPWPPYKAGRCDVPYVRSLLSRHSGRLPRALQDGGQHGAEGAAGQRAAGLRGGRQGAGHVARDVIDASGLSSSGRGADEDAGGEPQAHRGRGG